MAQYDYLNILTIILEMASTFLIPFMFIIFIMAIIIKVGMHITTTSLLKFMGHLEKKVDQHIIIADSTDCNDVRNDFDSLASKLMDITFYELYELKDKFLRRKLDKITSLMERIFLIREGSQRIMKDTKKQTSYCHKWSQKPDFEQMSEYILKSNPVYNRTFGFFNNDIINEILDSLPGLMIIGGIFGTFVGVSYALPELKAMDISNIEATKATMDVFLLRISYSMSTSIIGIILSVILNVLGTSLNYQSTYSKTYDKLKNSLIFMWNEAQTHRVVNSEGETNPSKLFNVGK